jgi:hypothetical protein
MSSSLDQQSEKFLEYDLAAAKTTGNPLYLWSAIAAVVSKGRPLPQPVRDYLFHVAIEILKARSAHCEGRIDSDEAVRRAISALQLVSSGHNAFDNHKRYSRYALTALNYDCLGGGESATNMLAKERGVSERTIYRDLRRYKKLPKLKE